MITNVGSLQEAINNLSTIDLSKFDVSEDSILIKEFYTNLLESFKSANDGGRNNGDRNFISRIFQEELCKTIRKMSKKTEFVIKEKDIANVFLKNLKKKKNIDLYVDGGTSHKIAIEIKTTLEFNPLGEAYLEALVTSENFDKFFVVSLCTTQTTYNKLNQIVENVAELKHTIAGIIAFMFYHEASGFEEGVINFFAAIRRAT